MINRFQKQVVLLALQHLYVYYINMKAKAQLTLVVHWRQRTNSPLFKEPAPLAAI